MSAVESTRTALRLATVDDRVSVIDAFNSYLNDVARFGHDVLPTTLNAESYWGCVFEPAIRDERSYVMLAEQDGEPVGALFWVIPEPFVEMRELSVVDYGAWVVGGHRRNSVATSMRRFAIDLLRERGIHSVVSTILKNNIAGLASYEKLGGKITGYMVEIPIVKGDN